jgi:DNA-binding NarL/FixJ family response regulator
MTITPSKIRVLCVDDSADIPEMLGRCIAYEPDMESVGSLSHAGHLESEVETRRADVVLLDMNMPGRDPLEAMRELLAAARARQKRVRVIAYSGSSDPRSESSAREAGACGYVNKDEEVPCVLAAIRAAAAGGLVLDVERRGARLS